MKRLGMLGMVVGGWLLISGVPMRAQSTAAATARQQADEAAARARAEEARQAPKKQVSPNVYVELPKLLENANGAGLSPFLRGSVSDNLWNYGISWNTSRSRDPLTLLQVAPGTWWNNADTATRLNLTKEQQKKMDDIFQQFRLTLIDLNASLSKEELIMDPLIAAERLDEVKILTQIDRIAQARAELEKANSRMLLAIRQSLTMEQWTKIQSSPASFRTVNPRK